MWGHPTCKWSSFVMGIFDWFITKKLNQTVDSPKNSIYCSLLLLWGAYIYFPKCSLHHVCFHGGLFNGFSSQKVNKIKIKIAALRLCVCLSWFKETGGLHSVRRSRVPTSIYIYIYIYITRVELRAKWGAIGNMLENTMGTWETCWEPLGDLMGTPPKKNTPYSPKRKEIEPLLCMLVHLIGCQEFVRLLVFFTSFGLGKWQGHKLWGHPHRYMCILVLVINLC